MGWSHLDISLGDLLNLVKGFVDILILTSGFQSSGHAAAWDAKNIKKALRWGLFFEDVMKRLYSLDNYQDSIKELDAVLFEMTSHPNFPQGLKSLSSRTLAKASYFVLECFFHALPVRDAQLTTLLTAVIEMDLDGLSKTDDDCLSIYIEKLTQRAESLNLMPGERSFGKYFSHSISTADLGNPNSLDRETIYRTHIGVPNLQAREMRCDDLSSFIVQELIKKQAAVSCLSSLETSLSAIKHLTVFESDLLEENLSNDFHPVKEETSTGFGLWKQWRSSALSYILDKRTVRLLSGANLVFSAPKVQWVHVFEPLKVPTEGCNDNLNAIIEISLLGLLSSKWPCFIQHLIGLSCDLVPISKQFYSVHHLVQGRSSFLYPEVRRTNSKEHDILEYLKVLLGTQPQQLWNLPPILAAAATLSCFTSFRSYLIEIERQLKGVSSPIRRCTCSQHGKEHIDCEVAERIWCLYMFHIQGSHIMVGSCAS